MTERSNSAAVRNPIASDPEVVAIIATLPPEAREALRLVVRTLSKRWHETAERRWLARKGVAASYYRSNAVNARHLALALRCGRAPAPVLPTARVTLFGAPAA